MCPLSRFAIDLILSISIIFVVAVSAGFELSAIANVTSKRGSTTTISAVVGAEYIGWLASADDFWLSGPILSMWST